MSWAAFEFVEPFRRDGRELVCVRRDEPGRARGAERLCRQPAINREWPITKSSHLEPVLAEEIKAQELAVHRLSPAS